MKKILYLHGFGSSGASGTVELLGRAFGESATVLAPDIPVDPLEALPMLKKLAYAELPDLTIGTSMGGMYAQQLHGFLHYHPSCSWMFLSDESWIGFNSIVTLGVSLSRKSIGVGLESRFSFCPYVPFAPCNCVPIYEPSFTSGYGLRVFMTVRY